MEAKKCFTSYGSGMFITALKGPSPDLSRIQMNPIHTMSSNVSLTVYYNIILSSTLILLSDILLSGFEINICQRLLSVYLIALFQLDRSKSIGRESIHLF
jgi:hypothetical protein